MNNETASVYVAPVVSTCNYRDRHTDNQWRWLVYTHFRTDGILQSLYRSHIAEIRRDVPLSEIKTRSLYWRSLPSYSGTHLDDSMAIILVCLIDGIAFYFTFKKSYHKPDEEKLPAYILWTAELACFALAVQNPTVITLLYPAFLFVMELSFVFFIIWRRNILKK